LEWWGCLASVYISATECITSKDLVVYQKTCFAHNISKQQKIDKIILEIKTFLFRHLFGNHGEAHMHDG
jgi:hypothetical protein